MKAPILFSIAFFLCQYGFAQELTRPQPLHPDLPFTSVVIDDTTPSWAVMLYGNNPNLKEVDRLYRQWRIDNPDVRNGHTRNLKHYMRHLIMNDGITQEGFAKPTSQLENTKANWTKKRKQLLSTTSQTRMGSWTSLGPTNVPKVTGRSNAQANIYALDQSKSNPNVLFAGSETDYVYKSTDKGLNWTCVNDDMAMGGYMEVEIHPTNEDIVYVGSSHDIYKTTDGGVTWQSVYYNFNFRPRTIIIDPTDADNVLVGGVEGLLRSTNGGSTWTLVTSTPVYDLKYKTDDADIVFALWEDAANLHTDFYRSTDGGATWTIINQGWDEPNSSTSNKGGRMTVSDIYSDVIYTFTGAGYTHLTEPKNGIKVRKSSDAGLTWTLLVDSDDVFTKAGTTSTTIINNGQGFYDWDIEMVDADTNTVVLGTQNKWLTTNGFSDNTLVAWGDDVGGHADLQEALFNGEDYWVATDGGIVKCNPNLVGYEVRSNGIDATEFWSFDQGWNRDAIVGTMYHNGTMGRTDSYAAGHYRFFGGAEPSFSTLKHPNPDKLISKGYGSVNGKTIPDEIDGTETNFDYNLTPNSNYAIWLTNEESEVEVCPYNYNVHWAGADNKLYKSKDFGNSWEVAYEGRANGKITKIEIPKSNADVMYVGEYHTSGYAIYKSTDGGKSFSNVTNLPQLAGSNDDGVFLSADHADADVLFIAFRESDNDNDKVWRTADGGLTWTNINTGSNLLDGESITDILAISGTDGDLYVTTNHGVFHRSNTQAWQALLDGLPNILNIRHIKPFYKESEVRIATMNRGVYSLDMINAPTTVVVQPTVNNQEGLCIRDTFFFDDYSILDHSGASWAWTFDPAPLYIDDANKRDPKATFPTGTTEVKVALQITKNGTTYTDSLDYPLSIENLCDPDDYPGRSYQMQDYQDHITSISDGPLLDEWTVSFWIKPAQQTQATATIFDVLTLDNTRHFCANFSGSTNNLTMHYQDAGSNAWGVNPGLAVNIDEWNHVAYTSSVTTGDVTLYLNGRSFTYPNVTALPTSIDKMVIGWQSSWWGGRYYQGEIDELAIYDRVLDQDEVRLRMHITKDLSTDAGLVHYYQWNEAENNIALDKIAIRHLALPANKALSSGPFADGTSSKMDITTDGLKDFSTEGLQMTFATGGTYPDGEVVVTRLDTLPDVNPSEDEGSQAYWVVHNFGSNATFTALADIQFEGFGTLSPTEAADPGEFELFERNFGQFGSWGSATHNANLVVSNPANTIAYNPTTITSFGQYYITKGRCMSSPIVTTLADAGGGSLRQAILDACPTDTITFDVGLDLSDILLTSAVIDIDRPVYLQGNGTTNTLISGGDSQQLFRILGETTAFGLEALTLKNGYAPTDGGAFLNYGNLQLRSILLQQNMEGAETKALTNYGTILIDQGTTEVKE